MSDLAARVRAIAAAAPPAGTLAEVWQRRGDESAPEYEAFVNWLNAGAGRGAPPAMWGGVAARNEWGERALAYERAASLAKPIAAITPEHVIISNLMQMAQLETAKLLQQSASSAQSVVGLKEIIQTISLITELQKAGNTAASQAVDTSKLTTEQKRTILEAKRLLQGLTLK